jgi:hypothetical protein
MERDTILLNGGRDHEVDCLDDADMSLVRLLGGASLRPAVPFLRTMHDAEGQQCVAVFIGSQHVGYLPQPVSAGLLATVQACEMNGAVARAKGNLVAAFDCPGKVRVKVSLADAEHLLHRAESEAHTHAHSQTQAQTQTVVTLEASLQKPPAAASATFDLPACLEGAAVPPLSAGWDEDYPDWPPLKPNSVMPVRPLAETSSMDPAGRTPIEEAPASPNSWMPVSTHSGWAAVAPAPEQDPQPGWLVSGGRSSQSLPTDTPETSPSSSVARAAENARSVDEEIIAAWISAPLNLRPATA